MRELKFRMWNNNTNKYEYTELAYYFVIDQRIKAYEYEQYTGLKDKNGKEIYEGDILDVVLPTKLRNIEEHQIWTCRFGAKRAGFVLNRKTNARIFSLTFGEINGKNLTVEVIGNIHENPELLEEKE